MGQRLEQWATVWSWTKQGRRKGERASSVAHTGGTTETIPNTPPWCGVTLVCVRPCVEWGLRQCSSTIQRGTHCLVQDATHHVSSVRNTAYKPLNMFLPLSSLVPHENAACRNSGAWVECKG